MNYTTLAYLLAFLPAVLALYGLLPRRLRRYLLLATSYLFYLLFSPKLIAYLLASTAIIYFFGRWMAKYGAVPAAAKKRRAIFWCAVILHLGTLLFLKFYNFAGWYLNALFTRLSLSASLPTLTLVLPLGISFFTLQAVSYLADVYKKTIPADGDFWRLALYMAFFPTIMEGPICRYSQTAEALSAGENLKYENICFGAQRIIWGLFKKLVIADRLNPVVATVFNNPPPYHGAVVLFSAICYTLQLYADFSGCIDITIGTAEMFGITLPENFRQPFLSRTPSEFWRRWHITLGAWLRDYIFYPLSLTRFVKRLGKKARAKLGKHLGSVAQTVLPLLAVWICNGLWHGTGWNYLFYGLYYFALILLGNLTEPLTAKAAAALHLGKNSAVRRALQTVKMAVIVVTGELFFRAANLHQGFALFQSIFSGFQLSALSSAMLAKLGLSIQDLAAVSVGLALVLIVGILHEKGIHIRKTVSGWKMGFRWSLYIAAILAVLIFGAYGAGYVAVDPIYANF